MNGAGNTNRPGRLFVISAPSGAGKTSLVKELVNGDPGIVFSISYTTRPKRPGEVDGKDYFFVAKPEFEAMAAAGEFLEHARVFDNYYGTHRGQVSEQLTHGRHVVLEIDWQGAQQVRAAMPEAETVFILPPSRTELERRLRNRATDSEEIIARRLRDAQTDMSHWSEFDYAVVNDRFDAALESLRQIIRGTGHASRADRPELRTLVKGLLASK